MISHRFGTCHSTLLLLLLSLVLAAQGAVIRVPQDVDSLQVAIQQAMAGDTVLLSPGTWTDRLTIGSGNLTLCSNYLFSQDSSDIVNTVLDGQDEGTILTVNMDDNSRLELNGLTLTRGRGDFFWEVDSMRAGAIHVNHAGTLHLANLVFHHNSAPESGAALLFRDFGYGGQHSRVMLDNINCYSNDGEAHTYNSTDLLIAYARTIDAKRLRVDRGGSTCNTAYYLCADESLKVRDLRILGQTWRGSAFDLNASDMMSFIDGHVDVADVHVSGNTFLAGGGISMDGGARGSIRARNLHLENNQFPQGGMAVHFGHSSSFYGPCHVLVDSVFIRDNVCRKSLATIVSGGSAGTIRHLFVTGNLLGQRVYHDEHYYDVVAGFTDLSVDGALFADNVMESCLGEDGAYNNGGSLLPIAGTFVDSLFYRNLRFVNNTFIDHDDYSPEEIWNHNEGEIQPNRGRMIGRPRSYGRLPRYVLLDSCEFVGNRLANIIPETGNQGGWGVVGSQIDLSDSGDSSVTYDLRNLQLRDCDDGGITLRSSHGDVLVRNTELVDVRRAGLTVLSGESAEQGVVLQNLLFQQITPQDHNYSHGARICHQSVLELSGGEEARFRLENLTITRCMTPYLLYLHGDSTQFQFNSSILADNLHIGLANPMGVPLRLISSLLIDPSSRPNQWADTSNLICVDPRFDPILGPPWLAADSPCVDAGDPRASYYDIEDPAHPGFARWPSRGGLRNDMGYTGGPHAVLLDTNRVGVPAWEPRIQPGDFSLGTPWPNPFNPVIQIPFTLARPARVRLSVFNLLGQEVTILVDGLRPAGTHSTSFRPVGLASGLYLVTLEAGGTQETRVVTLLR
jgi:hypothetical protein